MMIGTRLPPRQRADLLGHLVAADRRQQQVEEHRVEVLLLERLDRPLAIALDGDDEALLGQRVGQHPLNAAVVVDDEDVHSFRTRQSAGSLGDL